MLRPDTFALTALLAALTAIGPLQTDMYLPSLPDIARQLRRVDRAGAADAFGLSDRLRGRTDRLRTGLRPARPQAGAAGRARRSIARRRLACALCDLDRDADRRALRAGAGRLRRHRAGARHRARSLFRRARRPRIVGDGLGHGAGAGGRAADRRRVADRLRLALDLLSRWSASDSIGAGVVWLLLPETLTRARGRAGVAGLDAQILSRGRAQPGLSRLPGAGFDQLRRTVRLDFRRRPSCCKISTAVAVRSSASPSRSSSVGYMIGTTLAARLVMQIGTRPHARHWRAATLAAGGLGMVVAIALGLTSAAITGLADRALSRRPRHGAAAGDRRRHHAVSRAAGAASALLGFIQQSARRYAGRWSAALARPKCVAARRRGRVHGLAPRAAVDTRRAAFVPAPASA